MFYGTTTNATNLTGEIPSDWRVRLVTALLFFVPRANPDAEKLYPLVKEWALELSDDGWPQREVGLNDAGVPLLVLPNDRNTGFWTDMARQQFRQEELRPISAEEFERLWSNGMQSA